MTFKCSKSYCVFNRNIVSYR